MMVDAFIRRVMTDLKAMFACLSLFDDGAITQVESASTSDFGLNTDGKNLHEDLGSRLDFSTTFHPDGQSERMIQIPEDMLWSCVIDFRGSWEDFLPLAEFTYSNNFQSSIQMAPYKALYSHLKRRDIEYSVGDFVFLKVSPWKEVLRIDRKGKLSPRFIGPYQILNRVGPVVYQLELPLQLDRIHDVFHVSMLRWYRSDPSHVVFVEEIEVRADLTFEKESVQILDRDIKVLKRKPIPLVKVLWRNHDSEEATWDPDDSMRQQYPHLFGSGAEWLGGVFALRPYQVIHGLRRIGLTEPHSDHEFVIV
ncbi:uncharacterized protein LOC105771970 [Gossypium raimondii]|uniref:uncharacterized protein LOC105771970 n=1 Tax=Gossypium raimondii TaxID=29730 RepID=UPI00063AF5A5|nr:uncharacterized protein LOC105771970 [Gossypium raimondii]